MDKKWINRSIIYKPSLKFNVITMKILMRVLWEDLQRSNKVYLDNIFKNKYALQFLICNYRKLKWKIVN